MRRDDTLGGASDDSDTAQATPSVLTQLHTDIEDLATQVNELTSMLREAKAQAAELDEAQQQCQLEVAAAWARFRTEAQECTEAARKVCVF